MLDPAQAPEAADGDHRPDTQIEVCARPGHAWRLVGASKRGTSHEATGSDREDAFAVHLAGGPEHPAWFCIAVADGVGTARLARVGASRAVEVFVRTVKERVSAAPAPEELRTILSLAAWEAKLELSREAERRGVARRELGTTLLATLGVESSPGVIDLGLFQAGNGLIASTTEEDGLLPLIDPGDQMEDGSIYDLTSDHVQETWDASRFAHQRLEPAPAAVVITTDGIADDLLPLHEQAPRLIAALSGLPDDDSASARLLDEISYVKRGSGDDRTLVCAILRARPGDAPAIAARPPDEHAEAAP